MLTFFVWALLFLSAAIFTAPLAQRIGLGSVLGYLLGGVILSPFLALAGVDPVGVQHFAEFGVVMMLFLIGLELQPSKLWDMRRALVGLGGAQVSLTVVFIMGLAVLFAGLPLPAAFAVGLVLAQSSTAIVLQSLRERALTRTDGGTASFAVLLFQDVAVIPVLAIIPLLATSGYADQVPVPDDGSFIAGLSLPMQALATAGALALVILAGRFGVRPLMRLLAAARLRESLTAFALFLVIAIAALMSAVGLSPALGAFVAGLVLADSEFRVELEADLEPFKGLLMGVFFVSVGAAIDFNLLLADPLPTLGWLAAILFGKALILASVGHRFGLRGADLSLLTIALSQSGEFAFVLISLAASVGVFSLDLSASLTLATTLSMVITPLAFVVHCKVFLQRGRTDARPGDPEIKETKRVVVAGIGRFGQIVERMLAVAGYECVVLDFSPSQIAVMQRYGFRGYFGDASRPELLEAAGVRETDVFVVAVDDPEAALRIVHHVRQINPMCWIIARARDRVHYYRLRQAGAHVVLRELLGSSLEAASAALQALGENPDRARRARQAFRAHDQRSLDELYRHWAADGDTDNNPDYVARARALRAELSKLLEEDAEFKSGHAHTSEDLLDRVTKDEPTT